MSLKTSAPRPDQPVLDDAGFFTREFYSFLTQELFTVSQKALATTATTGFFYIPTCPGVPTGTPVTVTGLAPMVIDSTDNRLYFFSSGVWRNAGP